MPGRLKINTGDQWAFANNQPSLMLTNPVVQEWEGKPYNGSAVELSGDTNGMWSDSDNDTWASVRYGGFEDPWGHPAAKLIELPLSVEEAAQYTDVIVTWTSRLGIPSSNPSYPAAVTPFLTIGLGMEDYAGPNYHSLGTAASWGDNADSLYYPVNPTAPWEEFYLPTDGSWKTFRERLVPIYSDQTISEILSRQIDGRGGWPSLDDMSEYGIVDFDHTYVIMYQDSFWTDERLDTSEVTVELFGEGIGRLKVNVDGEWKFATPLPGENGGQGVLKVMTEDGWKPAG